MKKSKAYKILTKMMLCFVCALAFTLPQMSMTQAKDVYYEVVFRAGAHANFNGQSKVIKKVKYGDRFPDVPDLTIESGYVFKEWSQELPKVGTKVNEKQTYVAKCVPVISGQQYTVRYVDQNDVDIVSPKIRIGELDTIVTERAKTIENWPVDQLEKKLKITDQTNEIKFIYTVPSDQIRTEYVTEYETNVVDQVTVVTQNQNTPGGGGNTPAQTPDQTEPTTDVEDNVTPQGGGNTEEVEDNETPLQKGTVSNNVAFVTGGVALIIILVLISHLINKRKREENI